MHKLEVFFDYTCPYCLRGHEYLAELIPQYLNIEIVWRPCEAHPRPDRYGMHSDLCARGMFFAQEQDADLWEYHRRMYSAAITDNAAIEDLHIISGLMDGLLDYNAFHQAILEGTYLGELAENNRLAWETYQFAAVPSYCMNGKILKSVENIGVTKSQLAAFMNTAK